MALAFEGYADSLKPTPVTGGLGTGAGYNNPGGAAPASSARIYDYSSADTTGRYYSDDNGATWEWEQFATGDADSGIGGTAAGWSPDPNGDGIDDYTGLAVGVSPDPNSPTGYSYYGTPTWGNGAPYQAVADPSAIPYDYTDPGLGYTPPVVPGDADMGYGGSVAQMPGYDFSQAYPTYGDADQGIGGSVADMPGYDFNQAYPNLGGQPELAQWQGNPTFQAPSQFDDPLGWESPYGPMIQNYGPSGGLPQTGGFSDNGGWGGLINRVSYPFDYTAEIGGSIVDAQLSGFMEGAHGRPGQGMQTGAAGFAEAGGDLLNPNQAVEEFRERPWWQQLGYGAFFDATNLIGGVGVAPDAARVVRQAPDLLDATRPAFRGLGRVAAGELGGGELGAFRRAAQETPEVMDAKRALLDAVQSEANLRRVGTVEREITAGRAAQAGGIRSGVEEALAQGLSGEDLATAARSGATTGPLRRTFAEPLNLPTEAKGALFDDLARQLSNEEISPFEFLRGTQALTKVINGEGLQPAEIRSLRQLFGDEVADAVGARPITRAAAAKAEAREIARGREELERIAQRAEREAYEAEVRVNRLASAAQEQADVRYFRDKWKAIAARNDAEEIRTLLANPFMSPEERTAAVKAVTKVQEQAQREAGKAAERVWSRASKDWPEAETLRRKALAVIDKKVTDPKLKDEISRTVAVWVDQNRTVLDQAQSSMPEILGSTRGLLTGQLADSWLTTAMWRKADLVNALEYQGLDTPIAKKIADALLQRELRLKYPKGIPTEIQSQLDATKMDINSAARAAGEISQLLKNTQFGLGDFAVMGQQAAKAGITGAPQILAGTVNKLLALAHLPHVRTSYLDGALDLRVQNILDGAGYGSTGITDVTREGTLIGKLGKPGRVLDEKVLVPLTRGLTDIQFKHVLGFVRDMNIEGNLVLAKMAGANIDNPAVRRRAVEWANSNTSYARPAVNRARADLERAALLSPSMTRAQINQILQVGKLLSLNTPRENRLLAAATIASWAGTVMMGGKLLNDYVGIGDFEWDPSKKGFGYIKLPDGTTINPFSQEQVLKTIARSVRELAKADDADWKEIGREWAKLGLGRSSPGLQILERSVGLGFDASKGRWALGDLNEGLDLKGRIAEALPIPPSLKDIGRDVIAGEFNPVKAGLSIAGINAFSEDKTDKFVRLFEEKYGFNPFDDPQKRDAILRSDPAMAKLSGDSLRESAAQGSEGAQRKLLADDVRSSFTSKQLVVDQELERTGDVDRWKSNRKRLQDQLRGALDVIYRDMPEKPEAEKTAVDRYYDQIKAHTSANGLDVDWDAVDAWLATQPSAVQAEIDSRTGLGGTETEQRYRQATAKIASSGYYDLRDDLWHRLNTTSGAVPLYDASQGYYDWKDAAIEAAAQEMISAGKSPSTARSEAREHIEKHPVYGKIIKAFEGTSESNRGVFKEQALYPWATANPEAFILLMEWGFNPDSTLEQLRDQLEAQR